MSSVVGVDLDADVFKVAQELAKEWHLTTVHYIQANLLTEDLSSMGMFDTVTALHIVNSDVILLLVSPHFIASDDCWSKEMQWAITRHTTGDACVIPILLKPTPDWESTPLGKLQALPAHAKPISVWSSRNDVLTNVVEELLRAIHQVQQEDKHPVQEYVIGLQTAEYQTLSFEDIGFDEMEIEQELEQRIRETSEKIEGTLFEATPYEDGQRWIFSHNQQDCEISISWESEMGQAEVFSRIAYIHFTSRHLALLDRLIQAGGFR